jgi:hypothetical protein
MKKFRKEQVMSTEAQIKANRQNALKSTGPKSKQGKETVSQNAVKHGLCANKNVIRSESQDEFNEFKENMIADLEPAGAMEAMLAERIVSLSWRLKRAEFFQNMVIDALIDYEMAVCRNNLSNAREQAMKGNFELLMGHVINRDFANSRTLDLLLSYERRIESSLYKTTAEFRKMQRIRKDKQSQSNRPAFCVQRSAKHSKSATADELRRDRSNFDAMKENVVCTESSGESHTHPDKQHQDEDATRAISKPEVLNLTLNQERYLAESNPLEQIFGELTDKQEEVNLSNKACAKVSWCKSAG